MPENKVNRLAEAPVEAIFKRLYELSSSMTVQVCSEIQI